MGIAVVRDYLPLFKLKICSVITFAAIAGLFAAASNGVSIKDAAFLIAATMLASAAASAFNHLFDSDIDNVMSRTRKRPLPSGTVRSPRTVIAVSALLFAVSLLISINALNYMVALHLGLGAFVYVVVYTVWLKRRSWMNIILGGLAGSFAVLAGGASAAPELCAPPVLLAIVMFFWTPSHFWSFAICYREDYARAGVPMLPVVAGEKKTSVYIFINTLLLVASSMLPFMLGYNGWIYLLTAVAAGGYFIYWNYKLLKNPTREIAWKNFKISMGYIGALFLSVIVDFAF